MPIEIISASAGSGKTTRIAEVLRDRIVAGEARPGAVLATTFTVKAADELLERARQALLQQGRHLEAVELEGARIGTVNSVCGRLVADFAFELGIGPELRVIDEDQSRLTLNRVISSVVTDEERDRLGALDRRFCDFSWASAVGQVLAHLRSNVLDSLDESRKRSLKELLAFLPPPDGQPDERDAELRGAVERALSFIDSVEDDTDVTSRGRKVLLSVRSGLRAGNPAWSLWAKCLVVHCGKRSGADAEVEPVRELAGRVDSHPRLRQDLTDAITLVFDIAARAASEYARQKQALGVVDFVDQERLALEVLRRPGLCARLAGTLDLVLVDEFQDTSPLQLEIFTRLAAIAPHSIWVGDQKQAIFAFRGTDPALMDAAIDSVLAGREPETLATSWRSRPPLVELTSDLFSAAFEPHGLPASRVVLKPRRKERPELGPALERWPIPRRGKSEDRWAHLADGIRQLLGDRRCQVEDRLQGTIRRAAPGDVAVLCRTNQACRLLAAHLARIGIAATATQDGLLSTLEARCAVLGLRLLVDGSDRLAAAELARLLLHPDEPDEWLDGVLAEEQPVFPDASFHQALARAGERFPAAGPLVALDAVLEALDLRVLCARWGEGALRLANLEALRALAVGFVDHSATEGLPATTVGLLKYLEEVEAGGLDRQARLPGSQAVTVTTWHAAKGLEWPIVVLALLGQDRPPARFGLSVRSTARRFSLDEPLAGRWLRYWPNPFHPSQTTELRESLEADDGYQSDLEDHRRQELRLLYVGWTRARDRLVLAQGDGAWMLEPLGGGPPHADASGEVTWGRTTLDVLVRQCQQPEEQQVEVEPDAVAVARGPRDHEPAYLSPSTLAGQAAPLEVITLGPRLTVRGGVAMDVLGNALHDLLASDQPARPRAERVAHARAVLEGWGQGEVVAAEDVVAAAEALRAWGERVLPGASWLHELPVEEVLPGGTLVRGTADLVLRGDEGFVLVDHKSFPGGEEAALEKAGGFAGQLAAYAGALEAAWGLPCRGQYVHLVSLGKVVRLA